jgi:hypothetical protein
MSLKFIFGGVIAIILLLIYVYAIVVGINVVGACVATEGCRSAPPDSFNTGMVTALTLIGGLVSALVIAVLAVTRPGEGPARALNLNSPAIPHTILNVVTGLYLAVWILAGLAAFFVGFLQHPGVLQSLTDLGQSWLGLAVAAAYSYFGLNQGNGEPG